MKVFAINGKISWEPRSRLTLPLYIARKSSGDGIVWHMAYHGIAGGAGGQRSSKEERFVQFSFWPKSLSLMLNPLSTGAAADYIARFTVSCLQRAHLFVCLSACLSVCLCLSVRSSVSFSEWRRRRRPKADALQRTSSRDIEFCVQQRKAHTKPAQNKCFFVGLRNGRRIQIQIRQRRASAFASSQSQCKKIELHASQRLQLQLPPAQLCPSSAATASPSASASPPAPSSPFATNPPSYRRRKTTLIACRGVWAQEGAWLLQI